MATANDHRQPLPRFGAMGSALRGGLAALPYTTWGTRPSVPHQPKSHTSEWTGARGISFDHPHQSGSSSSCFGGWLRSFPFTRQGSVFQLDPCLDTTGYIGKSGYMVLDQVIKCRAAPARPTSMETFRLVMNREPDAIPAGEVSGLFEVPQTPHHRSGRFWQGQAL